MDTLLPLQVSSLTCRLKYLVVTLFTLIAIAATGQDKTLQQAFESSYANEAKNDYNAAILNLKSVYQEKSYEINLRLGWLCYKASLHNEAAGYYSKAIAIMPYSVEAKLGYVMPASALGNWDNVLKKYQEILKVDPGNSTANYNTGLIYYNRKEYAKALPYFEKLANLFPFTYDGLLMFAWTNLKLGKLKEARVLFNRVLLNNPGDASATEGLKLIK